jgi:2-polyprenyl-6-methoxyphenol hydroxylase-like FAD-dependent oxidoreductase
VRERAGLKVEDLGAPMDVLWLRLSREPGDPNQPLGRIEPGLVLVTLERGEFWQCAVVIPKGSADDVRTKGLPAFRAMLLKLSPWLGERVNEIASWEDVKLLTVRVDRLTQWWKPGLLCIGDAAHAMSPMGGVGVNLAVQDAVAAANVLAEPLRAGTLATEHLAAVQARRMFPTRVTQKLQTFMQDNIISRVLTSAESFEPPLPIRLLSRFPFLQRLPARIVGLGVRPEHVRTPEIRAT